MTGSLRELQQIASPIREGADHGHLQWILLCPQATEVLDPSSGTMTARLAPTKRSLPLETLEEVLAEEEERLKRLRPIYKGSDIPDEYLCPIMAEIMTDPVLLPHSKNICDRKSIVRIIMSDDHDPFTRDPLKIEDLVPQVDLKAEIEEFAKKHNIPLD